ncbi:MAG: acetyl-CoA carboxylase carboxyltransferase subunit alpha [Clostridia bacterium]|nr:acetyl-CoA carboxylase carboxyltransferase subunit alpha [Clostridia bacterium]
MRITENTSEIKAYDRVQAARDGKRPSGGYFISRLVDNFIEFHGDRRFGDDSAIIGGVGYIGGKAVTVIAMERGDTIEDRMKRHFGCPTPEGYRKALRLMKQAEKFARPIVCFIGSSGAYCGIDAEERGQGEAIAENLFEMMGIKVPIISVIIGEGGSGGALALGVCDTAIMLENSVYSVISPEGCASILWKDSAKAAEAAEVLKLTAHDLYKFEVIEKIIDEKDRSRDEITSDLKDFILGEIETKEKLSVDKLLDERYAKFRKIGAC